MDNSWTFEEVVLPGDRKGMIARHRETIYLNSATRVLDEDGSTFDGWVCAYVECKLETVPIFPEDMVNGGLTYGYLSDDLQEVFHYRAIFPNYVTPNDDKVVVGWDYNHAWDKSIKVADVREELFAVAEQLNILEEVE